MFVMWKTENQPILVTKIKDYIKRIKEKVAIPVGQISCYIIPLYTGTQGPPVETLNRNR